MTTRQATKTTNAFQRWRIFDVIRHRSKSLTALAIALMLVTAGVAILATANWNRLVASGVASVLISVLPCLVMCGLGLCMYKFSSGAGVGAVGSTATDGAADSTSAASGSVATGVESCCSVTPHRSAAMAPLEEASIQPKEKNDA